MQADSKSFSYGSTPKPLNMAEQVLYLFGDQTYDLSSQLKDLVQYKHDPLLEDFLTRAYDTLRTEIFNLSKSIRDELPRFTCLDDIIFRDQKGQRCVPLDMAITCMYQLGFFISRAGSQTYDNQTARALGLCTGTLATAAVASSSNTLELITLAVTAVRTAFRVGQRVMDVAHRIYPTAGQDSNWSILVPGLENGQEAIGKFCEHTTQPVTSQPFISAYLPNGITVSGPPHTLEQLVKSSCFENLQYQPIPIYGPYHAPHLYCEDDIDDVVDVPHNVAAYPNVIPVLSSAARHENFKLQLKSAVRKILLQPIRWEESLEHLQSWLSESEPKAFRVIPIGTKADQLIYTALKRTSLCHLLPTMLWNQPTIPQNPSTLQHGKSKLAIVGMSGRYPGAKDNDAFWDLLYRGLDVHKPVPALHWDAKTHVDPTGARKNTSTTPFGCWLDDPGEFDARFFNISPREAPQIDPAQRLALMTAYEAIEQAGVVPDATPSTRRDRVGVFYGVTSNDWMETNSAQAIDTYFIPGGNRAFIPGRINYCFKFSGPSFAVDTACSSSLAGIHLACNSLWRGDIDTAIAGGTNVLTNPDMTAGLDRGHFLSRTGNCKTFDDSADGYCRGEGVGTVIIKRLDDAIAEKDPILGVILSAYTNHSAESESITRPNIGAQRQIFSKILNQSAVSAQSVSYVEMHGTGTQAGDAVEMTSVLDTFAPSNKAARSAANALYLGSAKANIGHGEAASGVSSLIKVLMMMQKNTIVPHCGIKTKINSKFPTDLDERNVKIALSPTKWQRSSQSRRVFVNNFSAAGGNSAVLLEDAPDKETVPLGVDPRNHHVVAISAKSGGSLQGNLRSMLKFLKQNPATPLGKLSYTTTARRMHHRHRVMLTGATVDEISAQIETAVQKQTGMNRPKGVPNIVFTFTGQGAQYPGMGRELYETFSVFHAEMRRLDQIVKSLGFPPMLPVVLSEATDIGLFNPTAVQLASVCLQIALSKLWGSWGVAPSAVVGHSLGEYAALNVAGVLSETDTIYLVGSRSALLQKKCTANTHGMLVCKASVEEITNALKTESYEIACINSPIETVLAGPCEKIAELQKLMTGIRSTVLSVPYAFHSSQIDPLLSEFTALASGITFSKAKLPVICPLDGRVGETFDATYLARHSREPVNMLKALSLARQSNVINDQTAILEIGPHPAISGMVKAVLGSQITSLASLQRGRSSLQVLTTSLKSLYIAGTEICWPEYHKDFESSHEVVSLPAYSWELKDYWIQYVNDWSLRKGDQVTANTLTLESTTIHRLLQENGDSKKTQIVVEADIARKDLSPLVQGHEVDGVPLCTPSVYADIALTLGDYILKRYGSGEQKIIDVSDMTISKALILRAGATQQLLQAHAEIDHSSNFTTIKFMSFDNRQKLQEHSRCVVRFRDRSVVQELQKEVPSTLSKIQNLKDGIVTGATARFNRPMAYRAIRPLARFHDDYRAIDEIILNSDTLEVTSRLSFGTVKRDGTYNTHPALIDSLTQSCGFAMNCNDRTDLDVEVFMNHGWGSLQIFESLDFDKSYKTHTRMTEVADKLWHGDVMILDGERVVAFFGKVAIQGVPRRILKVVLSIEQGSGKAQKQTPVPKKEPKPQTMAPKKDASSPRRFDQAISIISEESGISLADFTDSTVFGDIGVDSLLGLVISARFKEELDVDFDFNALFFDCPTVRDLKRLLDDNTADEGWSSSSSVRGQDSVDTGATTPVDVPDKGIFGSEIGFKRALEIISEESGIMTDDLTDDTDFTAAGIDSLLSLVIVSRLRDELELDISHEFLFMECPTVGDLRRYLQGGNSPAPHDVTEPKLEELPQKVTQPVRTESETAALEARKRAVDQYVEKYSAGFSAPRPSSQTDLDPSTVVLVTGASGSLGSHLVDQISQLPDVKSVVCLNREKNVEAYQRQQKAMRDKGIRSFDKIKPKLLVLQIDCSKPRLGLSTSDYDRLVNSVTHLIHNAWPMSAKRALAGFESQFQVMRNLIDFANDVVSRRSDTFKFSFQMVSSIGVVGHYGLESREERIMVPEQRTSVDTVLPNGYGDAKWGCERMLDETLHKYPKKFRTMVVRLGQIAGSKTSGYWNPMEHFGFLIKSSQTLNALPDAPGTVFWTPVNDVAGTLVDLILSTRDPHPIYHIENPVGQPWSETNAILADALGISNLIPFDEWVERVKNGPRKDNPASTLLEFLDSNYLRMSCGGLVLDVKNTLEHSKTLSAVGPVSEEVIRKYIHIWKEIGFLNG